MAKVKQPKWKKALGTEGAISVKGGAYPVRGTGIGGRKVRGEVSKLKLERKAGKATRVIDKKPTKKSPSATKVEMKVTKAKRPIITHKQAVVASVAAGVAGAAVATRKKKPSTWSDRNPTTGVTSSFDHTSQQWIKNK